MCGRYQKRSDKQKIAEAFHLGDVDGLALEFAPDYNAAPQSLQPVIVWDKQFGARSLHMMFWRFLPPYVTDPKKFRLDTINVRGESLMDSNVWRDAFLHSRCLVPVDSFIEWKRVDAMTKLPWGFGMEDGEPLPSLESTGTGAHLMASRGWTPSRSSPRNPMNCLQKRPAMTVCRLSSNGQTTNAGWSRATRSGRPSISFALLTERK